MTPTSICLFIVGFGLGILFGARFAVAKTNGAAPDLARSTKNPMPPGMKKPNPPPAAADASSNADGTQGSADIPGTPGAARAAETANHG